jgi:hypothetical protein
VVPSHWFQPDLSLSENPVNLQPADSKSLNALPIGRSSRPHFEHDTFLLPCGTRLSLGKSDADAASAVVVCTGGSLDPAVLFPMDLRPDASRKRLLGKKNLSSRPSSPGRRALAGA